MKTERYIRALAVKGASVAALFACQVLLARSSENQEEFGYYNYVISVLNLVSFLCIWGVDKYLVREVSIAHDANDRTRAWREIYRANRVTLQNVAIFALPLSAFFFLLRPDRIDWPGMAPIVLLLLATAIARTSGGAARGLHRVVFTEGALNVGRPVLLIVAVGASALFYGKIPAETLLYLTAGSFFAANLLLRRTNLRAFRPAEHPSPAPLRPVYSECFPYLLVGVGLPLLTNLDVIILGTIGTDADVALYAACARVINLAIIGLVSVNLLIAPKLPILFQQRRQTEIHALLRKNNAVVALVTVIPIVILLTLGGSILGAFGPEYKVGTKVLWILLIGQVVNVFVGPVNLICMMAREQRLASILILVACALEAGLCYFLIPAHGAIGAAWANAFALSFLNLSLAGVVITRLHVNPTLTNLLSRAKG